MENLNKIKSLLSSQLGVASEKIEPSSEIVKDLGADSLDVVELLMTLEEEYEITVSEEAAMKIKTVQDIVALIENNK